MSFGEFPLLGEVTYGAGESWGVLGLPGGHPCAGCRILNRRVAAAVKWRTPCATHRRFLSDEERCPPAPRAARARPGDVSAGRRAAAACAHAALHFRAALPRDARPRAGPGAD